MDRRTFLSLALTAPVLGQTGKPTPPAGPARPAPARPAPAAPLAAPAWTQWGGPHRNFQTEAKGLKDTWPASGPRVVWKRPLGEGYSAPAVENGVLYTMYGRSKEEVVLAANAETGATIWEQKTPMTFQSDAAGEMGNGPYTAPHGRRRSALHDRRRRPAAVSRQEDRQGALDAAARERSRRLATDVRVRVEPDRVPRARHPPGRRPREVGHGVPAGRRKSCLGQARLRQRLLVADPHRRAGAGAARVADGRRADRAQPAQRRSAVAACRSRPTTRSQSPRRCGGLATCSSSRRSTTPARR